ELDINPSVEDSAFPEKYFLAEKAARDAGIVLEKKVLSGSNVMDI
ncbi:2636_t:CDS:2, partial [Paraglomus occultum]